MAFLGLDLNHKLMQPGIVRKEMGVASRPHLLRPPRQCDGF
jgi:hypothetical protein